MLIMIMMQAFNDAYDHEQLTFTWGTLVAPRLSRTSWPVGGDVVRVYFYFVAAVVPLEPQHPASWLTRHVVGPQFVRARVFAMLCRTAATSLCRAPLAIATARRTQATTTTHTLAGLSALG